MRTLPLLLTSLLLSFTAHAATTPCKWKDDKGTVHYGDIVPPQYAKSASCNLRAGDKKDGAMVDESADREQKLKLEAQKRKDKTLLATYTSTREIELARDRNLEPLKKQLASADTQLKQAQDKTAKLKKEEDAAKKEKKPTASIGQDIQAADKEVKRVQEIIEQKKKEIADSTARFQADIDRFTELKKAQ